VQKDVEASQVESILKANASKAQTSTADNDEFANFSL
jgi:hypothetical protein